MGAPLRSSLFDLVFLYVTICLMFSNMMVKKTFQPVNATAEITGKNISYIIDKDTTIIGRNSEQVAVDVDVGLSPMISNTHLIINRERCKFHLYCLSEKGIIVNGKLIQKDVIIELEKKSVLRFPFTNVRITFEPSNQNALPTVENGNMVIPIFHYSKRQQQVF